LIKANHVIGGPDRRRPRRYHGVIEANERARAPADVFTVMSKQRRALYTA